MVLYLGRLQTITIWPWIVGLIDHIGLVERPLPLPPHKHYWQDRSFKIQIFVGRFLVFCNHCSLYYFAGSPRTVWQKDPLRRLYNDWRPQAMADLPTTVPDPLTMDARLKIEHWLCRSECSIVHIWFCLFGSRNDYRFYDLLQPCFKMLVDQR